MLNVGVTARSLYATMQEPTGQDPRRRSVAYQFVGHRCAWPVHGPFIGGSRDDELGPVLCQKAMTRLIGHDFFNAPVAEGEKPNLALHLILCDPGGNAR